MTSRGRSARAAGLVAALALGAADARIEIGSFSDSEPGARPSGWERLTFDSVPRHTRYRLVEIDGRVVLEARAERSASGLVRRLEVELAELPVLRWSWKVRNLIEGGDPRRKEGDDYAARVYVTFAYDSDRATWLERARFEAARLVFGEYPPSAAITYVWDDRLPEGTIFPNPYESRARMVVVRGGREAVGRWVDEERNVLADYRELFEADPPPVTGVALMSDTDDTGRSTVAWFGDLWFERA